jgi:formate dehydrogenase maturation protein FdhE
MKSKYKQESYICPECGEMDNVECADNDNKLDGSLRNYMVCNSCGTTWHEIFRFCSKEVIIKGDTE